MTSVRFSRKRMADDHFDIVLFLLEWIWLPIGAAVLWCIKRLLGLQEKEAGMEKEQAILETELQAVSSKLEDVDERNDTAHQNIVKKIDRHHESITRRLDSLIHMAKNGNK